MRHRQNDQQRISLLSVLLIGLLCLFGCKEKANQTVKIPTSYAIDTSYDKGPLTVHVRLDAAKVELSGLITLELSATIAPDYEVQFPAVADTLKQFGIRSWKDLPDKLSDDNQATKTKQYQLEPLELGTCEIPALTFQFKPKGSSDEKEAATLTTDPVQIDVTTSFPDDPNALAIADIENVVDMKPNYTRLWIGLGIVCVLLIGAGIGMAVKPKKAVEIRRTYKAAHEIALEALRAIAGEKLVEHGRIKEFYEKLSACLRQYIENRFRLRAPEQTTEEFLEQLKSSDALKLEHKQELQKFLEHCDLVKFARYQPSDEQINASLTMAEEFVEKTKSAENLVDVTESQQAGRQVVS